MRGRIEEAIDEALKSKQAGRVLGGAFGQQRSYIDLLMVDGDNSVATVKGQLRKHQIENTKIHFFR